MNYGFVFPYGDPRWLSEAARIAEDHGWDGVFIPDCIHITVANGPTFDPWVALAAMAMRTERVRLGPMRTPLSRRRPWKVARETMSLDHLSNGRLILSVGLGALDDAGFGAVGEATDRRTRAEMLDESLAIITGLWTGHPFSFSGQHFQVGEMTFLPPIVQRPRIPIWVAGIWSSQRSLARALRWDGLLPNRVESDADWRGLDPILAARRQEGPFDYVVEGRTPGDDRAAAAATVTPFVLRGATWWLEAMWLAPNGPDDILRRVRQGPPRFV
ncbi:MAG: LLM class flavin-dependent oxidoreductase [Chloroflexota bacterium]|nr:MAG: LLM class flavin-dependent oxidoreductase [Chloroflexota bacterium]